MARLTNSEDGHTDFGIPRLLINVLGVTGSFETPDERKAEDPS